MCTGLRVAPGRGVQAMSDRCVQQIVPGRMEIHLVCAIAVTVMCMQFRRVPIRLDAPSDRLCAAGKLSERTQLLLRPVRALPPDTLHQRGVLPKDVVPLQWRRLVEDRVCGMPGAAGLRRWHRAAPFAAHNCLCEHSSTPRRVGSTASYRLSLPPSAATSRRMAAYPTCRPGFDGCFL